MKNQPTIWIYSHAGGSPYHGPNMRSYYLARNLVERGINVTIVSSSFFHKYFAPPPVRGLYSLQTIDGIDYIWLRTPRYRRRGVAQVVNQAVYVASASAHALTSRRPRPDVVIASSPHPFATVPASIMARRAGAKLIYEVRDLWPLLLRQLSGWSASHPYVKLLKWAEEYSCRHADRFVSVKPGDWEYFHSTYGVDPSNVCYIPNGFDHKHLMDEPFDIRAHCGIPRDAFVVGYTGGISSYYGMDAIVSAAKRIQLKKPNIRFVIVGGGDGLPDLRTRVRKEGVENVCLTGQLPKSYMLSVIRGFDVALVTLRDVDANRYGVSTNKLYEYMFSRKPVLGYYSTDHDPVTALGCGVTVRPPDVTGLCTAIEKLSEEGAPALRRLGDAGYRGLLENHSYEVITERFTECFESIRRDLNWRSGTRAGGAECTP